MNDAPSPDPQLQFAQGVTLLGGGELSADCLDFALKFAPHLVCADGGADHALALERAPAAIIGDMDSASAEVHARWGEKIIHISEQDSTDFGKCLRVVRAPFKLALGFTGGRVDHTLAAMSALLRDPTTLLLSREDVILRAPAACDLALERGTRLSLYPMGRCEGRSTGLRWPIDGLVMQPAGVIGTSNEALGPVRLETQGPMLLILPRACFAQALALVTQ